MTLPCQSIIYSSQAKLCAAAPGWSPRRRDRLLMEPSQVCREQREPWPCQIISDLSGSTHEYLQLMTENKRSTLSPRRAHQENRPRRAVLQTGSGCHRSRCSDVLDATQWVLCLAALFRLQAGQTEAEHHGTRDEPGSPASRAQPCVSPE